MKGNDGERRRRKIERGRRGDDGESPSAVHIISFIMLFEIRRFEKMNAVVLLIRL